MNEKWQDAEKSHNGRIERASAAKEGEEEGDKEEDEQKRIFFYIFNIIIEDFIEEEAVDQ